MKVKSQIELQQLIFTLNWEDPRSDISALTIQPGDAVMTITSGCCNTLEFLLHDPSVVYALDINPAQSYLMELKVLAFRQLAYSEFSDFMGLTDSGRRKGIYAQLRPHLSEPAGNFWDSHDNIIRQGILLSGRYESFVKLAGRLMRLIQGRKTVQNLFIERTLPEQQQYFETVFNTWQFRSIFRLLFNKRMLAKKGLNADYFHFDDGSKSFAESFYNRAKNVICSIPIRHNYFLALYLLGNYRSQDEIPEYLKEKNFPAIKERVNRIHPVTMDAKEWLQKAPENSINAFSLSNICELKSEEDSDQLFHQVARAGSPGARLCFRNLMIPREVPEPLRATIVKDEALSRKLLAEDRSFVYGKVAGYSIYK